MFTIIIPADGSSVPVDEFGAAAKASLELVSGDDDEKAQAKAAIDAAAGLVKAGHVGDANVYVVIGGIGGDTLSIGVHHRPAPNTTVPAPAPEAGPPHRRPFDTGPTQDEIAREAANRAALGLPRSSVAEVAADLGAATVTSTEVKDGVTTTVTKPVARKAVAKPKAKAVAKPQSQPKPAPAAPVTSNA